jgi:uncharacterized protein (TIGR02996 family)
MSEREAFERQIADAPNDTTVRLVFADWLDERGEGELAAAYRLLPHNYCGLDALAGSTVTGLLRADSALVFETTVGPFAVEAEGDCCSESWFYALRGVASLIGNKVIGFFEADTSWVDGGDGLGRQKSESVYGVGVLTTGGVFEVVYRNSSNGYHGGNLRALGSPPTEPMDRVTADWTHPPAPAPVEASP